MSDLKVVGRSFPQVDSPEKVRGNAAYVGDISLPRMLHAKVLRSSHAHARILKIHTDKALRVSGVVAVLTGEDAPRTRWGVIHNDQKVLAQDKVRYIGEEMAVVVADSEEVALEGLSQLEVDYEPLPAVFDPEEALKPDAPQVNEGSDNLAREVTIRRGDVERGFAESAVIHEDYYTTPHQFQAYMEPLGGVADIDGQGRLTVYASTQSIYFTQDRISKALELPSAKIRVVQPHIGGGFGGKLAEDGISVIAAFAALKTGRSVRLFTNRLEDFGSGRPRMPTETYLKLGLRNNGTIAAKETRIFGNNGASSGLAPEILLHMAWRIDSLYRMENIKTDARLAYTNLLPSGAFRGFGNPQMSFAMESHLDVLAEMLKMDPAEVRLRNVVQQGDISIHGWKMDSCAIDECIRKATDAIDWAERRKVTKQGNLRTGVGLACAIHSSSIRQKASMYSEEDWDGSTAIVEISEDGSANVICGEGELGQGAKTVFAQIAAEELDLNLQDVQVAVADTDNTPFCLGGYASRLTLIAGNAVREAAIACRESLLAIAADQLEAELRDLQFKEGIVSSKAAPERRITLSDIVRGNPSNPGGDSISVQASWDPPTEVADDETHYGCNTAASSFACVTAAVEVDVETGKVRLVELVVADDLGRAINPLAAEGQIHGEIAQGLGFAFFEHAVSEEGQFINGNLADYNLPKADGLPNLTSILIESMDPHGPFGAKGCSECALNACGAVIASAIYDAVGIRLKDLPITPQAILRKLRDGYDSNAMI